MVGSRWLHHVGSPPARQRQPRAHSSTWYVTTTSSERRSMPSSRLQTGQIIYLSTDRTLSYMKCRFYNPPNEGDLRVWGLHGHIPSVSSEHQPVRGAVVMRAR